MERLELAEGIDIWINEKQYEKASVDNLSLVIQNGEKKRPIFGNAFFATTDNLGNCISMNNEQVGTRRFYWPIRVSPQRGIVMCHDAVS